MFASLDTFILFQLRQHNDHDCTISFVIILRSVWIALYFFFSLYNLFEHYVCKYVFPLLQISCSCILIMKVLKKHLISMFHDFITKLEEPGCVSCWFKVCVCVKCACVWKREDRWVVVVTNKEKLNKSRIQRKKVIYLDADLEFLERNRSFLWRSYDDSIEYEI